MRILNQQKLTLAAGNSNWVQASDERLKDVQGPIENALEQAAQIDTVRFAWKDDPAAKIHQGFLAQNIQTVCPDIVSEDAEIGYLGVEYSSVTPLLMACIKELTAKVAALEARFVALEGP